MQRGHHCDQITSEWLKYLAENFAGLSSWSSRFICCDYLSSLQGNTELSPEEHITNQ
jgi:hypothetical protein